MVAGRPLASLLSSTCRNRESVQGMGSFPLHSVDCGFGHIPQTCLYDIRGLFLIQSRLLWIRVGS